MRLVPGTISAHWPFVRGDRQKGLPTSHVVFELTDILVPVGVGVGVGAWPVRLAAFEFTDKIAVIERNGTLTVIPKRFVELNRTRTQTILSNHDSWPH